MSISGFDQYSTIARISCCSSEGAPGPYQSVRLSRYDASSSAGANMRRREFIAGVGGAAVWPLVARAQQTMPVIGFLASQTPDLFANHLRAFRQGLGEAGYVDDRNVKIEYRWAQGQYDRLSMLAADLVNRHVDVIAAIGPPAALAAKAANSTISFVFTSGGDVVKSGLVVSLNRPGGNATGVNLFTQAVEAKKLELLAKLVPTSPAFAFLINPHNPAAEGKMKEMQDAARGLGRGAPRSKRQH